HVSRPQFLARSRDRQVMRARRQQQFLLPEPEIVVELIHMTHKISRRLAVGKYSSARIRSADIHAPPRPTHLVTVRFQPHSEVGRLARLNVALEPYGD